MKFISTKEAILAEIIYTMDFTTQKNNLAITSNVYLEAVGDQLIIKATDGKVGFATSITVDVVEEGKALVLQEKLLEILRLLPNGEIKFATTKEHYFSIIPNGGTQDEKQQKKHIDFKIRMIEADQFPKLEVIEEEHYFALPQQSFLDMSEKVVFAVSDDNTRIFLCGVYIERSEGGLTMVATDGRRLSIVERVFEETLPTFAPIIVLPRFFHMLRKIGTGEGMVELAITESTLFARIGGRTFYINLIREQYPNFRRVIPEQQSYQCTMKIQDMEDALRRVAILIESKAKRLFLDISEGGVLLTSDVSESGEAKEVVPCQYEGPDCKISLNYTYLLAPLRAMEGEYFSINFTEATRSMTVKPESGRDYMHIIMPMQLNQ